MKIDKNKRGEPIFKLGYKTLDEKEAKFLRRAIMEGKEITGMFKNEIPLRFFLPIFNNLEKENIKIDRHSKLEYLEFSDFYDEKYFYSFEVTPKYMKKWREEGCPNIFKIQIDKESMEIKKDRLLSFFINKS